jgi:hypothetical protein
MEEKMWLANRLGVAQKLGEAIKRLQVFLEHVYTKCALLKSFLRPSVHYFFAVSVPRVLKI